MATTTLEIALASYVAISGAGGPRSNGHRNSLLPAMRYGLGGHFKKAAVK